MEQRSDRFTAIEDQYAGYEVRDPNGEKIGKVDDMFLDENDTPEYIGVKMGFLGTKSTLIPMDIATIDEGRGVIEVSQPKSQVKDGPAFDDDEEITPEYEERVRSYYGLESMQASSHRGSYGAHQQPGPGIAMGDREGGEFREHALEEEGLGEGRSDLDDSDELRVQRSEEELRAGTREREAGRMKMRKRVETERQQLRVPKRREEVSVERVPVNEPASEAQIGEDEVVMPVVEEEVVVEKRPVVKEEVRLRTDVVEEEEIVEADIRKEQIDIDDKTRRGNR